MGTRRINRLTAIILSAALAGLGLEGRARATDTVPADVPGFGGSSAPPRLLVILDTSRSMRFNPSYTFEDTGLNLDFVASPRTPDASCTTKFCIAKRAMYDVLSATGSLLDGVGISGYYQTRRIIHVDAIPNQNQLTCTYDVIAKANQDLSGGTYKANVEWKSRTLLDGASPGSPFTCDPTSSTSIPGLEAAGGLRGNYLTCVSTNHTCKRYTGTWPQYDTWQYRYQNPGCAGSTTVPYPSLVCTPPATWLNPGDGKTYTYSTNTWDGTTLWRNATAKSGGVCPATYFVNDAGALGVGSCTAANKCDWYLWSTTGGVGGDKIVNAVAPTTYIYHNIGAGPLTIGSTTYDYNGGLNSSQTAWVPANNGDICPTTRTAYKSSFLSGANPWNCAATPDSYGCDLSGGSNAAALSTTTTAASTMYAYNISMNVAGYSLVSSSPVVGRTQTYSYTVPIASACDHAPGEFFNVTSTPYHGLTLVGVSAAVGCSNTTNTFTSNMGPCVLVEGNESQNTDTGLRTCTFTQSQYQYFKPAVLAYYCAYTSSRYYWATAWEQCRYRRKYYQYGLPYWYYFMYTDDGDLIDTTTKVTAGLPEDKCALNTADTTVCPANYTGGICANAWVKTCKLRWTGRYSQTNPNSTAAKPFCQANDTPPADRFSYKADWCANAVTATGYAADVLPATVIADYYSPSTSNPTPEMQVGMPTTPVPRTGWYEFNPPLHATKDLGLSFYNSGANAGTAGVSFVPIVPGNAANPASGDPFKALQKYDAATNPLGLQMPSDGNYTPLYGAIVGARDYLSALANGTSPQSPAVAADPATACRGYYVILVTDGDEEQPGTHTPDELGQAVADLRAITGPGGHNIDAQTFVIGFGVASDALDQMAIAGGHAVDTNGYPDPSCVNGHCTSGHAYNASDSATLSAQLKSILDQITSGSYSRSKPILSNDGARFYTGYFSHSGRMLVSGALESAEWKGHLDAFDMTSACTGDPTGQAVPVDPAWQFDRKLDVEPGTGFRRIYTHIAGETVLRTFDDQSHNPDGSTAICNLTEALLSSATCTAPQKATADTVIQFTRNDRGARATFNWGGTKTSRLSDIYHASPAILGPPSFNDAWTEGPAEQIAYHAFKTTWRNRPLTVFVGSNTGMLHAVHEDTTACAVDAAGTERWAFVPHSVLATLPDQMNTHHYTVDGSLAIADVCFGSTNCARADGTGWKTILVGTLGWGGNAIYALDISDVSSPAFLWESENLAGFGQTWGAPVIGRVAVTTATNFKWGVFIGGGVSNVAGEGDTFQVLDAQTGQLLVGSDPVLDRASWSIPPINQPAVKNNVPARPRIVFPYDQSLAAVVYFGDTDAKISRMNVTNSLVRTWAPTTMFNPFADPHDLGCPLTTLAHLPDESTVSAVNLPLVAPTPPTPWPNMYNRPYLGIDDGPQATGNHIVYIGTGNINDPRNINSQEYFFAVRDDTDVLPAPTCAAPLLWGKTLAQGDKVLSDPVIYGSWIIVAVYKPPLIDASCAASGRTTLYCFDRITGEEKDCLKPPLSDSDQHLRSYLDLGNVGIISDLYVHNGELVYTTSNRPDQPVAQPLGAAAPTLQIRTWRRVQ